jgi:DNA-binding MltR family transcriptional regulator
MEWVHVSKDVESALREIETDSDRAAAIVAATLVDEHLTLALRHSLHQNKSIANEMFSNSGPLGSFASKINLAFLIGIFSIKCHKELNTIKRIRNLFAHNLTISGCESEQVNDLVKNLVLHQSKFTITNLDRPTVTTRSLVYTPEPTAPLNNRDRYIRACKYYTEILSMQIPGRVTMPQPFF